MQIDPTTVTSAIFLCFVTSALLYGIFFSTQPDFTMDKRHVFSKWRAVAIAVFISAIFSAVVAYVSVKVDKAR